MTVNQFFSAIFHPTVNLIWTESEEKKQEIKKLMTKKVEERSVLECGGSPGSSATED